MGSIHKKTPGTQRIYKQLMDKSGGRQRDSNSFIQYINSTKNIKPFISIPNNLLFFRGLL